MNPLIDPILSGHPPLPREEEAPLIKKAQQRTKEGQAARDLLVKHNLKIILQEIKKIKRIYLLDDSDCGEDLLQEGVVGLLDAIDQFDTKSDWKLITFAIYKIRARMVMASKKRKSMVWVNNKDFKYGRKTYKSDSSLNVTIPLYGDETDIAKQDLLVCTARTPDDIVEEQEFTEKLGKKISRIAKKLEPIEADLLNKRTLADEEDCVSLHVLGEKHGMSRQAINQREHKLHANLRKKLKHFLS